MILSALLFFGNAKACCDRIETDFNKTVKDLLLSSPGKVLVVIGRVKSLRIVEPYPKPSEMEIEIERVLVDQWDAPTLIAKRVPRSSSANFENYIPGKTYRMAFLREEIEGATVFTQGICGRYFELIK